MKIAITGGSGRVGQGVTLAALDGGHEVVSIDRVLPPDGAPSKAVTFVKADVVDYDALVAAFAGCDAVIHMAAIPHPMSDPNHVVHNNNVVGSYNALRAAVENQIMRICQASSVNAIGHAYSRDPRYDYFPIDESHPCYAEDPYSLSKWICEQQADAFARRYEGISIASMRFHWVTNDIAATRAAYADADWSVSKHFFTYTGLRAAAAACLLSVGTDLGGHEVFFIAAPNSAVATPSMELAARYAPGVPVRGDLSGTRSFFDSSKAERLLGWNHNSYGDVRA
jgi:nucleoside-diphosphate-sugar epimerase